MLDEKEWMEFPLGEIFVVNAGKRLETRNKISGKRPFIGATDNNNGITGFVGNINASKDKNVLGVNYNGAPCIAFYHPYECIFTDDVKRLHLKGHADTSEILLYFTSIFAQQRAKYGYGYKFKEQRMLRQKLMLPVTDSSEPDYDYMTEYVQECRKTMLAKYRAYVEARIAELGDYVEIPSFKYIEWQACRLSMLGQIESGRDIYALERIDGYIPYITSGSQNNGIGYFVDNCNDTYDRGYIALNRNGAVGQAFYHPYFSVMGNDCRKLHLHDADNNLYVGVFVAMAISMQRESFGYSRKLGTGRANKLQIMLPVTDSGEPDYEYMEQYAKNMMLRKYKQYLTFLDSKDKQSERDRL